MKFLAPIIKLAILAAIIVGFFYVYNTYLVDRSLEGLELSLTTNSYAQSAGDMRNLNFFLDEVFTRELGRKKIDDTNLSQLEFAQSIAFSAKDYRQVKDVQFFLDRLAKDKISRQSPLQRWISQIIALIKSCFVKETVYRPRPPKPEEDAKVDMGLLKEARSLDYDWKLEEAISKYEHFLKLYPTYYQTPAVMLDLGYAYLKNGNYEKAETYFKLVEKKYPQEIESMFAKILLKRLDDIRGYERERSKLTGRLGTLKTKEALQQNLISIGILSYKMFDYGRARDAFEQAVRVYPDGEDSPRALFYLGLVLKSHKLYDDAIEAFKRLANDYPDCNIVAYAHYQVADIYQLQGKFELSAQEFEKLAAEHPETALGGLAQFRAGYIYQHDLKDSIKSYDAFQKLGGMKQGGVLNEYGREVVDTVVGEGYLGYAFQNLVQYRLEEAKHGFLKVIDVNQTNAWAHSGLGEDYLIAGVLNDDKSLIQKALDETSLGMELLPDDALTLAARGYVINFTGGTEEAIKYYEKALKVNPYFDIAWYNLGNIYLKKGNYQEARRCYQKTLEVRPTFAVAHSNLGCTYWAEGNLAEAIKEFSRAVRLNPNLVIPRFNLARLYEATYDYGKALKQYRKVLAIDPKFEEVRSRLEALEEKQKDRKIAEEKAKLSQ